MAKNNNKKIKTAKKIVERTKAKAANLSKESGSHMGLMDKNFKCQICGKKSENPIDAMTHLLDHGSSALEGVSKLIKDQKEGRVSKEYREDANQSSATPS